MKTRLQYGVALAALLLISNVCVAAEPAATQASAPYPEQPAWFKESFLELPEDIAEAAAAGRRVMLYFHQEGCPYCARLLKENFGDPAIAARTQAGYDVIALNLWGDRELIDPQGDTVTEKRLAESLRVQYTPTLVILDEQGGVALRINGYYPKDKFILALEYGLGKAGQDGGLRGFVAAREAAPPVGEALPDQPFFRAPPFDLTARTAGRPLLVIFEQPGCTPCREMHEKALTDPNNLRLIEGFDVVRLDATADTPVTTPGGDQTTARGWADRLEIAYAPSLLFFDDQGQEVFRVEAFLWSFHFQSALDYVASGGYHEQPSFQRFLRERRERMQAQGLDVRLKD